MARSIQPIVEGPGDVAAVPVLLRRLLHEAMLRPDTTVMRPVNCTGKGNLRKRIQDYISYCLGNNCDAILVLFDADSDCALELVREVCEKCRGLNLPVPIAVVCAVREYETWFLASVESAAGGQGRAEPNPESVVNPKERLKALLGGRYRETEHQAGLSAKLDLDATAGTRRSFRRLRHAVEELVDAIDANTPMVSPALGS